MPDESEVKREGKASQSSRRKRRERPQTEQNRPQPYRSLTIERDEAPDPDVKHIAGEATGTRAERDTVSTIESGRREIIG